MKVKLIQLAYILGIALILAGLIYFFAANWQGFTKATKLVLSVGVMLLFYGLSYGFYKLFSEHQFLSRLLLFAGCVAFGISIALVGQIYNSHANSYIVFLTWFIVALLLSIVTRYQPLYVLSYTLAMLTFWSYFFPEGSLSAFDDSYIFLAISLMIVINILIFLATEKKLLVSQHIKLLSYMLGHALALLFSMRFFLETYFFLTNSLYVLLLAACFYYFFTIAQQKTYITVTGIAATAYAIIKYIELLSVHFGPPVFIATIVLAGAIVYINVLIVKRLKAKVISTSYSSSKNVITIMLTIVASIVATVSLMLLISDTIGNFQRIALVFFFLGLIGFLLTGLLINKRNEIIGGTLMCIGYLMSSIALLEIADIFFAIWLVLVFVGLITISSNGIRMLLYILVHIALTIKLYADLFREFDLVFISIIVINLVAILITKSRLVMKNSNSQSLTESIKSSVYRNSFFYVLLFFFMLTFVDTSGQLMGLNLIYNILFFILITALLFWAKNKDEVYEFRISLGFWFAFLFYKYYDLIWQLLHKSIAMIVLGVIVVVAVNWIERKYSLKAETPDTDNPNTDASDGKSQVMIWSGVNKKLIISLIILQLLFLGVQIAVSEHALANGQQIKLQLEPVDPRSLMQGDYVILNYTISQPTAERERQWEREQQWDKDFRHGQRLRIVLAPDEDGVHQYKELYAGQQLAVDEVVINGTYRGWRVLYGIETYFVPEGTGLEVERAANYAYVRISSRGNAIIERLSED
ncbi:GDYXXLXY domain-containing protein [Desulfuribacillus alkaliarsenatis]|uniref:DUF2157 domain-containing protein n=1 Tax=Desulfuribacillus alkaliarsenatis TaxID=766136 RepID=A0A1E5FZ75_9FIRM|nr:GDYXXLXY domain-containing protein [Desulfuribacillus alkaliarsenatis]OEF95873.1 hypothetical protein BHF68_10790 [Desulfuribacillus alkaliarsenatis]